MYHHHTNTTYARRARNTTYASALGNSAIAFISALGWACFTLLGAGVLLGLGLAAAALGWWLGINYPM
jgi:hypothetical protein